MLAGLGPKVLAPIPLPGWDPIPGAQRTPTTQNQNDVQISLANPITFRLACGFGAQGPSTDPAPGMGSRSRGMKPPNGPQRTQKRNYVQISLANPITFRLACGFGAQGSGFGLASLGLAGLIFAARGSRLAACGSRGARGLIFAFFL